MTHVVQSGRCALLTCVALLAPLCAAAATSVVGDLPRAADRPLESLPGVDTEYGELRIGGDTRLRTIVTRPAGVQGRLPAVLFVQWLSCDSIEIRPDATDGWTTMLRRRSPSRCALAARWTSRGSETARDRRCSEHRYETSSPASRGAAAAAHRPDVDPKRVDFGASMGSNMAPLSPQDRTWPASSVGGRCYDWYERTCGSSACARARRHRSRAARAGGQRACGVPRAIPVDGHYPTRSRRAIRSRARSGRGWSSSGTHTTAPVRVSPAAQRQKWAGAWVRARSGLCADGEFDGSRHARRH